MIYYWIIIPNVTFPLGRDPNSAFDECSDRLNIFEKYAYKCLMKNK